jgi:hypothetical protein
MMFEVMNKCEALTERGSDLDGEGLLKLNYILYLGTKFNGYTA